MQQKIKKNLLLTLEFPPNYGGVAAYYYNICNNLPGDKIVVAAPEHRDKVEVFKFDHRQKFNIVRKNLANPAPKNKLLKFSDTMKWVSSIKEVGQIIKNHDIEMLQVGQILPLGTVALAIKTKHKIPYVVYAHGLDIIAPQQFMRKKKLIQKIINGAQNIIANSNFTKDELVKLGADPEKIIVVYPCPNLQTEAVSELRISEIKKKYELENKKIILTVGRLVKRKGHDMVIKSLPYILKKVPNAVYLIVGSGPYQKTLQTIVSREKLGEHVIFTGSPINKDLEAFYEMCDVFAMPARQLPNGDVEGFGITYLEANAFSKPVIGGRSGGVPEAILDNRTGILVDPEDRQEIATKITDLLLDSALAQRLGMQGLERITDFFDWKIQTEKIEEILK